MTIMMPLAQLAAGSYDLIHIIIVCIVLAGIIGIFLVVIRQAGINIPGWVLTILWIVLAVVVAVIAIKFLAGFI